VYNNVAVESVRCHFMVMAVTVVVIY